MDGGCLPITPITNDAIDWTLRGKNSHSVAIFFFLVQPQQRYIIQR